MSYLSSVVFFVVLVQPLVGWSESHSKLARCGRAGTVWGILCNPFPHARVGSAVLKRAAQSPWMLPNASSAHVEETSDHWSKGHLHAGLWLWLPVITFTCCFATFLLPQVLREEEQEAMSLMAQLKEYVFAVLWRYDDLILLGWKVCSWMVKFCILIIFS